MRASWRLSARPNVRKEVELSSCGELLWCGFVAVGVLEAIAPLTLAEAGEAVWFRETARLALDLHCVFTSPQFLPSSGVKVLQTRCVVGEDGHLSLSRLCAVGLDHVHKRRQRQVREDELLCNIPPRRLRPRPRRELDAHDLLELLQQVPRERGRHANQRHACGGERPLLYEFFLQFPEGRAESGRVQRDAMHLVHG